MNHDLANQITDSLISDARVADAPARAATVRRRNAFDRFITGLTALLGANRFTGRLNSGVRGHMEPVRQANHPTLLSKIWPILLLGLGLYRLADWIYGGRQDLSALLAGIGFLLMAPGAFVGLRAQTGETSGNGRRIALALTWTGLAFVVAAIARRWM